jgi:hypothetical protein
MKSDSTRQANGSLHGRQEANWRPTTTPPRRLGTWRVGVVAAFMGAAMCITNPSDTEALTLLRAQARAETSQPPISRFQLIALATFPRSGTSWTLNLLRMASGMAAGSETKRMIQPDVSTSWPSTMPTQQHRASVLDRLLLLHRATPEQATDAQILRWLRDTGLIKEVGKQVENKAKGEGEGVVVEASGVKESPHGLLADCGPNHPRNVSAMTSLRALPPIVIKTHAPTITHHDSPAVARLLADADVRVHTVRNPLDNIVSRFHGNRNAILTKRQHGSRKETWWADLVAARSHNSTTEPFDSYINEMASVFNTHHRYWVRFADAHTDAGKSVFVRYESLCSDLDRIFPELLRKVGYVDDPPRVQCAISMFPCSVAAVYPEHARFYTDKQRQQVLSATQIITDIAGYAHTNNGTLAFTRSKIDMLQ